MMRKLAVLILIVLLTAGCVSTFKEKRQLSKPMVGIAMHKIQRDDIQGALVELRRAAEANPGDPEIYYAYAVAYWKNEKFEKALENIDRAVELSDRLNMDHPGLRSEALNLKGTILVSMGKPEEAVLAFKEALKHELYATPEYSHYNLASVYYQTRRYPEAERSAMDALEANAHYAPAWKILGQSLSMQGRDGQAIEAFRKAILEFPDYAEAHWETAQVYFKQGDVEKTAEHLREVVRIDGNGLLGARARQSLADLGAP